MRLDRWVDLMLSGHTHGGQVTFFGAWAPILPLRDRSYWRGVYQGEMNRLIITNGTGYFAMNLRIFAPASMEIIELRGVWE